MEKVWTVKRLETGLKVRAKQAELFKEAAGNIGRFATIITKQFETRKIEIISQEKLAVIIPGRKGVVEGFSLFSQNISNPKLLSIGVREGNLKQDLQNIKKFFILGKGIISIGRERGLDPLEKNKQPRGSFKSLPVEGPDLTSIDGMELYRTGTFQVIIKQGGALIILS